MSLNARMYDPTIARFLQEDTYTGNINDPLSLNLYVYCNNNPLVYHDPTGHFGTTTGNGVPYEILHPDKSSKGTSTWNNGVPKEIQDKQNKSSSTSSTGTSTWNNGVPKGIQNKTNKSNTGKSGTGTSSWNNGVPKVIQDKIDKSLGLNKKIDKSNVFLGGAGALSIAGGLEFGSGAASTTIFGGSTTVASEVGGTTIFGSFVAPVLILTGVFVVLTPPVKAGQTVEEEAASIEKYKKRIAKESDSNEGGSTVKLPNQGLVRGNVEGAPPVDAGKQGKHVPGHNNNNPTKSQWPEGETGVDETQEAWVKGTVVKPDGSVKIYNNGTETIKVHIDEKGNLHGYPIDK